MAKTPAKTKTKSKTKTRPRIQIDLKKVERLASRGLTQEQIASSLGISERTLYERKKESADFAEAIKRGQSNGIAEIANVIFEKAMTGETAAAIFFLKTRAGWSEKQEFQIEGGAKPVKHEVTLDDMRELPFEELTKIALMNDGEVE